MGTAASFQIATLTDLLVLEFIYEEYYDIDIRDRSKRRSPLFNKVGDDL
jgi:hypothetical protein